MTKLTVKHLEYEIDKNMLKWVSPYGFSKCETRGVFRWKDDAYIFMACVVVERGGENKIRPFGQMGFKSTQTIYQRFMFEKAEEKLDMSVDLAVDYANFMKNWSADMICNHQHEVTDFLDQLKGFTLDKLYPLLASYRTPRQVLDLYLKRRDTRATNFELPNWHGYSSALKGLILSRIYAPEYYPGLKKRYQPIFDKLEIEETTERINRLIYYLDTYKK